MVVVVLVELEEDGTEGNSGIFESYDGTDGKSGIFKELFLKSKFLESNVGNFGVLVEFISGKSGNDGILLLSVSIILKNSFTIVIFSKIITWKRWYFWKI